MFFALLRIYWFITHLLSIVQLSFSVYYITVKVNNSYSRLTLSHTIAHAEDRPPSWRFFIVFWGGFFCFFQNSFYEIEIAAFSAIVTKPIFFFDVCASFQFLNGTLYWRQRKMQIFGYSFHGGIAAFCFFTCTFTKI